MSGRLKELYTVEVVDPPPGWDDKMVEVRHRNIPYDQIGHACAALLDIMHRLTMRLLTKPGHVTPTVTVRRAGRSSSSSIKNKTNN